MSKLVMRIDKYLDSDGGSPPEAFARIQTLDPSTGRNMAPNSVRQERVPISNQQTDGRGIDLTPGYYQVEAVLPSGEILTETIEVKAGANTELVLKADASPHEWLGWQHLVGNVFAGALPLPKSATSKSRITIPARKARQGVNPFTKERMLFKAKPATTEKTSRAKATKSRVSKTGSFAAADVFATPAAGVVSSRASHKAMPQVAIGRPVHWLSSPLGDLANSGWISLAKRASSPAEWIAALNSGGAPVDIAPYNADVERAIYRVTHGSSNASGATSLGSPLPRDYVVVERPRTVELVSLPLPWPVSGTGREAIVEIVVQQLVRAEDFATSIAVRDEHLGLLLGFLSTGALSSAQQIAEDARDLLFVKAENPLAAAAGGYALVGTESDTRSKDWHGWIQNLMNRYPHVPDGAIQWATLVQRQGPSRAAEACEAFKTACRRGPPYFSLGLRWLLDGLERFAHRDTEAKSMAQSVRSIASRMHQQSPFTIIRLGER